MSAHNFWNSFTHGFMHGMFNSNPFFGCWGGFWGGGMFAPPFSCGFGWSMPCTSVFLTPNIFAAPTFFQMMPDTPLPMIDVSAFDYSDVFAKQEWIMPDNLTPWDTFTRTNGGEERDDEAEKPKEEVKYSSQTLENAANAAVKLSLSSSVVSSSNNMAPIRSTSVTYTPNSSNSPSLASLKGKHWSEMSDSEMQQVYGNYTRDITTPYKGTAEDLNKYLQGKGVLEGQGQAFINAQNKYGISASTLVGIAMNESAKGTSNNARTRNNIGGVRIPGSTQFKTYASVTECIDDIARFLKAGYVNNKGRALTKLYQVNAKYCPATDTSDTSGINSYWARNVEKYAAEAEALV